MVFETLEYINIYKVYSYIHNVVLLHWRLIDFVRFLYDRLKNVQFIKLLPDQIKVWKFGKIGKCLNGDLDGFLLIHESSFIC